MRLKYESASVTFGDCRNKAATHPSQMITSLALSLARALSLSFSRSFSLALSLLSRALFLSGRYLTPTWIRFNRFLKLILLEHKPLLACFGLVTIQKWLVSEKINLRKRLNLINVGAEYRARPGEEDVALPKMKGILIL